MGSAFRSGVIAGLRTDAVELVPSVPGMFGYFYPDAAQVLANPNGHVVVTDGRNYMELTDKRYDIIVTDPPPPIESSGVSVISSLEYYRAGHDRLNPGGIMMQWVPYGQTIDEFRAHVRTFAAVYPNVMILRGPGGYGFFMLGSDQPMTFSDAAIREVLARPGILAGHLERVRLAREDDRRLGDPDPEADVARRSAARGVRRLRPAHHGRPAAAGVLPVASILRDAFAAGEPGQPGRGRVPVPVGGGATCLPLPHRALATHRAITRCANLAAT